MVTVGKGVSGSGIKLNQARKKGKKVEVGVQRS
jgi:hypothetical protein